MNSGDKHRTQIWYVRRGHGDHETHGPYPAGLVTRYILLGRILKSDEVSSGDNAWSVVSEVPELIPEVVQLNTDDPVSRQRLMAAKRWADERMVDDRRQSRMGVQRDRRSQERRVSGNEEEVKHRDVGVITKEKGIETKKERTLAGLIATGIVIALAVAMFMAKPRTTDSVVDCNVLPNAGVNWSNCHKEGALLRDANLIGAVMTNMSLGNADFQGSQLVKADLSYSIMSIALLRNADMRQAILVGANLRQSDLENANLEGADLSYADLTGANIRGVNLDNAKLDNAIWIDGRTCGLGSTGQCLTASR